jgi:hypothetical protein
MISIGNQKKDNNVVDINYNLNEIIQPLIKKESTESYSSSESSISDSSLDYDSFNDDTELNSFKKSSNNIVYSMSDNKSNEVSYNKELKLLDDVLYLLKTKPIIKRSDVKHIKIIPIFTHQYILDINNNLYKNFSLDPYKDFNHEIKLLWNQYIILINEEHNISNLEVNKLILINKLISDKHNKDSEDILDKIIFKLSYEETKLSWLFKFLCYYSTQIKNYVYNLFFNQRPENISINHELKGLKIRRQLTCSYKYGDYIDVINFILKIAEKNGCEEVTYLWDKYKGGVAEGVFDNQLKRKKEIINIVKPINYVLEDYVKEINYNEQKFRLLSNFDSSKLDTINIFKKADFINEVNIYIN